MTIIRSASRRMAVGCAMAFALGALLALAAPPTNFVPALWIAMAGLAFVLDHFVAQNGAATSATRRGWRERVFAGGALGFAFGLGANLVVFRFIPFVVTRFTPLPTSAGIVALILLAAAEALRWWAAAIVRTQLVRQGAPRWLAFGIGVYVGTFVPVVFPWNPAGAATPWPALVQLAELVGERGVTLVMALVAGLAANAIVARRPVRVFAALAIVGATAAHGAWRIRLVENARAKAPHARIALVQPAIEANERWDPARADGILATLTEWTRAAERDERVELTVWPEASYPFEVGHHARRAPIGRWAMLGDGVHGPVLAGAILFDPREGAFNSAVLVTPDGALVGPYDKMHLLWFGEAVPLGEEIPWLRRTFAKSGGLRPGHEQVALTVSGGQPPRSSALAPPPPDGRIRAAVLNCFEDTLPAAGREAMGVRPNVLVNLTNDAWFVGSAESELHLRLAALRSVELRRDMVRAVNGGPTSWVDAAGRVRARRTEPGFLVAEPALLDDVTMPTTVFARFGDVPCVALSVSVLVFGTWRSRRKPRREA